MRVDDFNFDLPRERIADRPAEPRDASRLLVVGAEPEGGGGGGARLADRRIADLPDLLRPGDLLVFNDTRVIPARLVGRRGAAIVEVTLHQAIGPDSWWAFARGARRLRPGDRVVFAEPSPSEDFAATVAEKSEKGQILLRFDRAGAALRAALDRYGSMPLPPYVKRPRGGDPQDRTTYQTIFAAKDGAVAAPTAGLHFTDRLLAALDAAGIGRVTVTLHVGAGTFLPVKAEDTRDHRMHSETAFLTEETAARINRVRAAGGRIVAVGTTSLRTLESAADESGRVAAFSGDTDLFVTPGYRFKAIDLLLTNFHLPRST
ncbi:MAG TPA: tRNA preQ1(34) S-adenosylmethionine ribosyltransferase-isomerase QueA, partial [Stellaceae bacterium]